MISSSRIFVFVWLLEKKKKKGKKESWHPLQQSRLETHLYDGRLMIMKKHLNYNKTKNCLYQYEENYLSILLDKGARELKF